MKEKEKKSNSKNYLVQGSILAVASIIAKIIGMIYRFPLTNTLGNEGNSYYSTANEVYNIVLMISSFSLPLAVSKLVSERIHKGEFKNAHRVFLCAMRFALIAGGALALLTYVFAGVITKYVLSIELAVYALRVLAPAIFVFAIVGVFRGFFQGYSNMTPTAVSQVIEQIVNAIFTVVCANIMYSYGVSLAQENGNELLGPAWGAAGGTFGTVVSITVAMLFMMFVYTVQKSTLKRQMRRDVTTHLESERAIYRTMILTIIPIVLSTLIYNISNVADQGVFNKVLLSQGYTEKQYTSIWGIYSGQFRVLMNVPLSLASCLAPSVVPSLTAAMARGDRGDARRKIRTSVRFTMIITIPCAVGMAALAKPILTMLYPSLETGRPLAVGIMQAGALLIILYAFSNSYDRYSAGTWKAADPADQQCSGTCDSLYPAVCHADRRQPEYLCGRMVKYLFRVDCKRFECDCDCPLPALSSGMETDVSDTGDCFHYYGGGCLSRLPAVPFGVWQYDLRAVCNPGRGGNLWYRADFL